MTEKITICTDNHDSDTLALAAQDYLLNGVLATRVASLFKALSDPARIRVISLLAHTEMCVGDLCLALGMSQPAISHQLRILRNLSIVSARRQGQHMFYTLADQHIHDLYCQGLAHVEHD